MMSFKETRQDFFTLTRQEVADALNISLDVLDRMHARGDAPPRFRSSPHRWCYPLPEFRAWQKRRLRESDAKIDAA